MSARQNSRISFWQGWNAALDVVWQGLTKMPQHTLTPDQVALREGVFDFLRARLFDEDSLKPKLTNAELAEKYAVSPRTVTNWRKEDCPFAEGQPHVLNWATEQRLLPRRFKVKFARQLQKRREKEDQREHWDTLQQGVESLCQRITEAQKLGFL
jgi:hypothetical protein